MEWILAGAWVIHQVLVWLLMHHLIGSCIAIPFEVDLLRNPRSG